jgi:hypothetical protein
MLGLSRMDAELVEYEEDGADRDRGVGDVEVRPG